MDIAVANGEGEHSSDGWRLPALTGRRAAIARAVYAMVAALIIIVVAGSFWFNGRDYFSNIPTAAEYGFRTGTFDEGPRIHLVTRRERGRSDLRTRDRIVSIDGVSLPTDATEYTIGDRLGADSDGRVTIVTESRDGARRTHVIDRLPVTSATQEPSARLPLWLFVTIGFLASQIPLLFLLGASLILAWRRSRDPEAMLLALGFLLLCLQGNTTFWLLAFDIVPAPAIGLFRGIGSSLTLLAVLAFPDGRFTNWFARAGFFAVALLIALQILEPLAAIPSVVLNIASILVMLSVIGAVWTFYRRTEDPTKRQQIKWALFGFGAALCLILPIVILGAANLLPTDGPLNFWLGRVVLPLALTILPIGVLISLLRYRLYDADTVIGRSAVYSLLTVGFVAVFAASQKFIEILGEDYFGRDVGAIAGGTGAALAAVAIAPMHARVRRWAERRFQRPLYRLRHTLPALVGDLRETAGLRQIAGATLDSVVDGVQARRAAVLVGDTLADARGIAAADVEAWRVGFAPSAQSGIDCDNSDPLFPVRVPLEAEGHGRVGWLLLGPRPDGSLFGKSEWDVIEEIAEPVARAIQVTLRRAERESEIDGRLSALEALISARQPVRRSSPKRAPQ